MEIMDIVLIALAIVFWPITLIYFLFVKVLPAVLLLLAALFGAL